FAQALGGACVLDRLGPQAADVRDRALHRADDVRDGDLLRRPRKPVAALGAPLRADDPGMAQVAEDVLQELERDLLRLGDSLALDRAVPRGSKLDRGAER